jgi:hypothetical protein
VDSLGGGQEMYICTVQQIMHVSVCTCTNACCFPIIFIKKLKEYIKLAVLIQINTPSLKSYTVSYFLCCDMLMSIIHLQIIFHQPSPLLNLSSDNKINFNCNLRLQQGQIIFSHRCHLLNFKNFD